jgi:hypothetical protein
MSYSTVVCNIGKEVFYVRPDDLEEIHRIREFCESIALEKAEQYLKEKYPDQVIDVNI